MPHQPTLTTPLLSHRAAPRAAGRRPSLAARGATLARMLFVPGAAEQILHELDGSGASPRKDPS